jgi:hypothetical protein
MKDFLGNQVNVGDKIVCIELGYKNLVHGEIVKITPKAMRVKYMIGGREQIVLRYVDQIVLKV